MPIWPQILFFNQREPADKRLVLFVFPLLTKVYGFDLTIFSQMFIYQRPG